MDLHGDEFTVLGTKTVSLDFLNLSSIISMVECAIPTAYAEEIIPNGIAGLGIDYSFQAILSNNTRGGVLLSQLVEKMHLDNPLHIPLTLSNVGQAASIQLINMINDLPTNSSPFAGDLLVFNYVSNWISDLDIRFNFEVVKGDIVPTVSYTLPIGLAKFPEAMDSGVYQFTHKTLPDYGIGSATHFRSRLSTHMASFIKQRMYMHKWFVGHGGVQEAIFSPIIAMPNVTRHFGIMHPTDSDLCLGGHSVLQALNQ